jgi:drug/metabolite transporter (DMT)-like permease
MLLGSIPIIVIAFILPAPPIQWTNTFIFTVLFNVILSGCVAWVLWLYALQRLQAGVASMASMLAPVIGVIAAWIQLNEVPNTYELVGMVFIALSLITISGISILKHSQIDPAQGQE